MSRSLLIFNSLVLIGFILGCGKTSERVSVSGVITREDGAPLSGAQIICRSRQTGKSASGVTNEEGFYELGTMRAGEGVPPGEYYVLIIEDLGPEHNPRPRTILADYQSPKRSGLSFTLREGESLDYSLSLDSP